MEYKTDGVQLMSETRIFFKVRDFKIKKKFAIIISNAFTIKWLRYLMRSLNIQKCRDSFAVIVVDYGNDFQKLKDLANKSAFDTIVVSLKNIHGTANQRNIGMILAKQYLKFEYLLFIDSDIVILDPSFFCKLKHIIEKAELPAFTHVLFNSDGSIQWSHAELIDPFLVEFKSLKKRYTAFLHGAFFSLKDDVAEMLLKSRKHLFPPLFLISFDDYFLSLVLHSFNIQYFPVFNLTKIIHFGGSSLSRISEIRLREAMKNLFISFAFYKKTSVVGIISEYIFYSLLRYLLNGKFNVIKAIKSLLQGLVLGILYAKMMKT
jgi:hypothetical protein